MEFKNKPILGMIHLAGQDPIKRALEEIKIYEEEGISGIIVENYHNSVMCVAETLKQINTELLIGVNVLPNDYLSALTFSKVYKGSFVQVDQIAGKYEQSIEINDTSLNIIKNAFPNIKILGGVWPKYYVPIKGSILKDDIETAIRRTDAIVVTGAGTGKETPLDKIKEFRELCGNHPLIVGAGLTSSNVVEQLSIADGAIVGSCFKPYNMTTERVERSLVKEFMSEVNKLK